MVQYGDAMEMETAKERLTEVGLRARIDREHRSLFGGIPSSRGSVLIHGFFMYESDGKWIVEFADDGQIPVCHKHETLEEAVQTVVGRLRSVM